ncbi:MAG TPA: HAMP domain-containing sensor histidine kinase [Steroidobacteraceae bacterium]|jgi:two-component system sensor histidine kinase GlrK|nr:HAMP domain-containing sensor histidine kinase [Steroidobacteraceae bacterium]
MWFPWPKSLSGLMMVGFTFVAAPLLYAVVIAGMQMNHLSTRSEELVLHGIRGTRNNQRIFEEIGALERTARLYQIIGSADLLEVYGRNQQRLKLTLKELLAMPLDPESHDEAQALESQAEQLYEELKTSAPNSAHMADIVNAFPQLSDMASKVSSRISAQIDRELATLQSETLTAQQNLFWETLLLVPITLAVVGGFTYFFGRPIRAIDRAISELGRGTFSRPIAIRGPADLERLAAQLEWLRGRLLDLAQEKNRFLRHMSHELKTPLANIREGTELLMDGAVGELQSGQREVTAILRENGMKLQRLIENLLSFSAWQAKSVGLEISEFKLRPLIKSVLENQQLTLVAQRVRLDVHVEDLTALADRGKIRLILDNLLSNAIKFTPRGGTISIQARGERDKLVLDVMDSGPGIPAEERNRIFEAFYQGKTPQGGHVKGTGIGLSVVTEFVNAHGGTIEILEAKTGGAHFRVRLPLRQSTSSEKAHAA